MSYYDPSDPNYYVTGAGAPEEWQLPPGASGRSSYAITSIKLPWKLLAAIVVGAGVVGSALSIVIFPLLAG
jgi:hypothetical protein